MPGQYVSAALHLCCAQAWRNTPTCAGSVCLSLSAKLQMRRSGPRHGSSSVHMRCAVRCCNAWPYQPDVCVEVAVKLGHLLLCIVEAVEAEAACVHRRLRDAPDEVVLAALCKPCTATGAESRRAALFWNRGERHHAGFAAGALATALHVLLAGLAYATATHVQHSERRVQAGSTCMPCAWAHARTCNKRTHADDTC